MQTTDSSSPVPTTPAPQHDPAIVLDELLQKYNACSLASTGGPTSPWLLGIYFAHDRGALYTLLEVSGRTLANLKANPHVAILLSNNDATQDFVQSSGIAEILDGADEDRVRQLLVAKMPWYATYTPVVPVRVRLSVATVTSLARGWFPGKRVELPAT